jgi:hypothetical protein
MLSSLVDLGMPFEIESGLLSDDCDKFRAFWADPSMPSRLKVGVRAAAAAAAALSELGDLSKLAPLEPAASWGEGISTVKSRFGSGYCLTMVALADVVMVAVAESGESPLEDGDMLNWPGRDTVTASKGPRYPEPGGRGSLFALFPIDTQSATAGCSQHRTATIQAPQTPETLGSVLRS